MKPCKDCGSTTKKQTDRKGKDIPGPRCQGCWRQVLVARKAVSHETRTRGVYGLQQGDYERQREAQGGFCAILGCKARGISRALAVEHNHETGEVRGLTCAVHNEMIGRAGDDPAVFIALALYLIDPPARKVLRMVVKGQEVYRSDEDVALRAIWEDALARAQADRNRQNVS